MDVPENVLLEEVSIIFRNFTGKEKKYNAAGKRNFSVLLDDDTAERMAKDGWNVKWLKPYTDEDSPQAHLKVNVHYGKGRPPRVVLIGSRGRTTLDEDMVEMADWVDIRSVDLMIRPYRYDADSTVSAYLQSIYIIVEESYLDRKYADVEEVGHHLKREIEEDPDDE
jgi:hypothetical protein